MTTITMKEVAAFLLGEASLDGYWFGERHPISPFWWREHLRAALSEIDMTLEAMSAALAAPATAPDEQLRKDSERYRWLRSQHWSDGQLAVVVNAKASVRLGANCPSHELLDEAIDSAMKGKL